MVKEKIKKLIPLFVKNFLRRIHYFLNWSPWIINSYSQEGEDLVLQRIFANYKSGFYVDVGAHHPKRFSNTFLFIKKDGEELILILCLVLLSYSINIDHEI